MNDIRTWLTGLGLQQYADVFTANDIDLASVGLMTDADFEKLGVTLGHRKRLLKAAATLADGSRRAPRYRSQSEPNGAN